MATLKFTAPDLRQTKQTWNPVHALVMYRCGHEAMCLSHPVLTGGKEPELGAARNLSDEQRQSVLQALGHRGLIPVLPNTLAVSPSAMAWWRPPSKAAMQFDAKYQGTASIRHLSGKEVPLPGLVFIASPNELRVYATAGQERPALDTVLYHAPMWNMFSSGTVCRGTATYPAQASPTEQAMWEEVFFNSLFTGPSRSDRYMNWGKSYEELLQQAIDDGAFPQHVLVSSGKTLQEVL